MLKKKIKEHFIGSCFQTCDMSGPATPASLQYTPISSTASKDKTLTPVGEALWLQQSQWNMEYPDVCKPELNFLCWPQKRANRLVCSAENPMHELLSKSQLDQ